MSAHTRQLEMAVMQIQEQQELLCQTSQTVGEQRTELREVREAVMIFQDLLRRGLLAWLGDLLVYAEDEGRLLSMLDVLKTCQKVGLKLNPSKCDFFKKSVKWCGRVIGAKGVPHDPDRICP